MPTVLSDRLLQSQSSTLLTDRRLESHSALRWMSDIWLGVKPEIITRCHTEQEKGISNHSTLTSTDGWKPAG